MTGVDIAPQAHYCGEAFVQADALAVLADFAAFDAQHGPFAFIHASPPCQGYSTGTRTDEAKSTPRLIAATREALRAIGLPYVIENVNGARAEMRQTPAGYFVLCGSMFDGDHARRHRLFESEPWIWGPPHPKCRGWNLALARRLGVDYRRVQVAGHGRDRGSKATWGRVMGIDWMTQREIVEAIPPAYTEWIGAQLLNAIRAAA